MKQTLAVSSYLALKEIWRNRGRFLLVSLVIALITLLVLFIAALGEGLGNGNREYISKLNGELLVYQAKSDFLIQASRLSTDRVQEVRAVEGVADAGMIGNRLGPEQSYRFALGEDAVAEHIAQHLLVLGDDAGLAGSRPAGFFDHGAHIHPQLGQFGPQPTALGSRADHAGHCNAGTQQAEVLGNVGGPPEGKLLVQHRNHGHRGLGRNPLHMSPDVLVQHQVADDEQTTTFECRKIRLHRYNLNVTD